MKLQHIESQTRRVKGCAIGRVVFPLLDDDESRAVLQGWLDDPRRSAAKIASDLNGQFAAEGLEIRIGSQTPGIHRRGSCGCE